MSKSVEQMFEEAPKAVSFSYNNSKVDDALANLIAVFTAFFVLCAIPATLYVWRWAL